MPNESVPRTSKGWPYIDPELYFRAFPAYTQQLATKLDNADADVAAAINAAATLVLTPWTTLSTGFSAIVTGGTLKVRRNGREVEIDMSLTASVSDGNTELAPAGFLPAAFRPSSVARMPAYLAGGYHGLLYFGADGSLGITQRSGGTRSGPAARGIGWVVG